MKKSVQPSSEIEAKKQQAFDLVCREMLFGTGPEAERAAAEWEREINKAGQVLVSLSSSHASGAGR